MHDGMGGGVAQGGGHLEALRHLAMVLDEVSGERRVAVDAKLSLCPSDSGRSVEHVAPQPSPVLGSYQVPGIENELSWGERELTAPNLSCKLFETVRAGTSLTILLQ